MDSYHVKQQFFLGAYRALADMKLPDQSSADFHSMLLYKARAFLALDDPKAALQVIGEDDENVTLRAVRALSKYTSVKEDTEKEAALEELRDLALEIEGEDSEHSEKDKAFVRVLAATAFVRAGETEEALETLGTDTEDLEAVALLVQIYLSINRPDLAKKQFERSKKWAEDDLLLQLIESNIGLVTGKDAYSNPLSFYTEQLANPSLTSPHVLTSRGITRILRNEIQEAQSDLDESLKEQPGDAETLAALCIAGTLGAMKPRETEELWSDFCSKHPDHPSVVDVAIKSNLFDQVVAKYTVPPIPAA
ncbi:hypothetical protein M378DRAFT_157503 [Amanita muscaria Koide BX008]|uniref:Coatomer subunit epsilon n=1 Tax=Amanita muscaria (strain Koide BX008) TaxID=946122 RepID=A0A0C2XJJ0_AMAMK|nr:hypothetical protein M378DRAFT_157503 [Amanita muscaria Koide BX008]